MAGMKYFLHNLCELAFLNIPLKCATSFSYKAKLQPSDIGSCDSLNHAAACVPNAFTNTSPGQLYSLGSTYTQGNESTDCMTLPRSPD